MDKLSQVVDANGNVSTMQYDSFGRMTSVTDALGNVTANTLDPVGNVMTVTDPKGNQTTYGYDFNNRLTSITYPDTSTELFSYDKAGNVIGYTNNNGQSFTYTYDAANRLVQKMYNTDSTVVQYGRDAVGNLTTRIERNGDVCLYRYDGLNRLVAVERDLAGSVLGSGSWLQKHHYDANSNRISWSSSDRINNLNQIQRNDITTVVTSPPSTNTVTWRYTWDFNGNMLTRTDGTNLTTYTWDEDNRLTQVQLPGGDTVSYTYDDMGRMITRTDSSGTTSFVWDGMDCVQETDPSSDVTRYYIPNGRLLSFMRGSSVYQVHADALGSVRKVTDSSGTVQATFDYDAWGNALASTSDSIPNGGLQYRFVGALGVRWDAATGLYYMRARRYDPGLGRFLSRDVIQAPNRYCYAIDSPTTRVDPTGLDPQLTKLLNKIHEINHPSCPPPPKCPTGSSAASTGFLRPPDVIVTSGTIAAPGISPSDSVTFAVDSYGNTYGLAPVNPGLNVGGSGVTVSELWIIGPRPSPQQIASAMNSPSISMSACVGLGNTGIITLNGDALYGSVQGSPGVTVSVSPGQVTLPPATQPYATYPWGAANSGY